MILPLCGVSIEFGDGGTIKFDNHFRLYLQEAIILPVGWRYFLLCVGLEFVVCRMRNKLATSNYGHNNRILT